MSREPVAACHDRIEARSYRAPREQELADATPCKFCFVDGEIDVDQDDLLVAKGRGMRLRLHRDAVTGDVEWEPVSSDRSRLATELADPDVTDPSDLLEDALEGDV